MDKGFALTREISHHWHFYNEPGLNILLAYTKQKVIIVIYSLKVKYPLT